MREARRALLITDLLAHWVPGDSPSRGLETGVLPLVLLQIGDATGVMAVGDARPAEQTKELLSISGNFRKFPGP